MRWIFKTFWSVITVGMALLGLVYLPVDYLDRERAMEIFWRTATVGNREILLVALCALAICRIFYLELRQGTQGQSWQPIRKSLLRGLATLFKNDKRIAELKTLGDHPQLQQILDSGRARHILDKIDWSHIPMPPVTDFSEIPDNMKAATYKQTVTKPTEILMERINCEIKLIEQNFGDCKVRNQIIQLVDRKLLLNSQADEKVGRKFEDDSYQSIWINNYFYILSYNQIKDRIREILKGQEALWVPQHINEASSQLNQSLRSIAVGIQQ